MQRSILQRRSKLQDKHPPGPPKDEAKELAEALFPNASMQAANKAGVEADSAYQDDVKRETLGPLGIEEENKRDVLPEKTSTVHDENCTELLSSNPAEELAEDFGPVIHEWGRGEPTGMREVQGSWRVTASTRKRPSESVGLGNALSTQARDDDEPSSSALGPITTIRRSSFTPKENSHGDTLQGNMSKRPRSRPDVLVRPEVGGDATFSTNAELSPMDASINMLSHISLTRGNGRLPWKSDNLRDTAQLSIETEVVRLPFLSLYTNGPSFQRKEWKLPRPGFRQIKFANSSATENLNNSDCSPILESLNEYQRHAVISDPNQACLVLAGPGSGKTRVLTHRVAYLVKKHNVSPYRILAVTFTNKAAEEMKKRVAELLGIKFSPAWAQDGGPRLALGTFHSISARILRKHGSETGITSDFVICDTSDTRQLISRLLKNEQGSTPDYSSISEAVAAISKLKNDRDGQLEKFWPRRVWRRINELRNLYDKELRAMNHLDFDDLLLETKKLLQTSERVRGTLQETYEHVLVDEWQDTNHVQFDIVSLLSAKHENLFVVGDADQSIYKFRGADSGNLERFMEEFPNAAKIALEENYRSSGCIVAAAQAVIEGNTDRPSKKMTTVNDFGAKVILRETLDDRQESQYVVSTVKSLLRENSLRSYSDVAILYRTNAQSRLIEEAFIQNDIPYRLLSGTKFYDRQEIRDLVAYLRVLSNPADDTAFRRIVNTPPRGIGKKTQEEFEQFCLERQVPLVLGLSELLKLYTNGDVSDGAIGMGRAATQKLAGFADMLSKLQKRSESFLSDEEPSPGSDCVDTLLTAIIEEVGYRDYVEKREGNGSAASEKVLERLGNIEELVRASSRFSSLHRYLEGVTLMVDTMHKGAGNADNGSSDRASASLMTLHGGKGLEFGAVFIIGAEDSVIPISRGAKGDIEEERRLLYVGMTRAKEHLQITWRAKKLVLQGGKAFSRESSGPSRFLDDIPAELVTRIVTPSSSNRRSNHTHSPARRRGKHKTGRLSSQLASLSLEVEGPVTQWRAGDSVRCGEHGRGTVTIGGPATEGGAWIEVMFADGSRHFVNTIAQNVELLYTPSS